MKVAAWARTDRGGNVMLTGNLQRDEPRKDKAETKADGKAETKTKGRKLRAFEDEVPDHVR
jgi:hypothetical protein